MCPDHSYMLPEEPPNAAAATPNRPIKQCAACHYSCLQCHGPNDYECTRCIDAAQFRRNRFNQSFCMPTDSNHIDDRPMIHSLDGFEQQQNFPSHNWNDRKYLIFFLIYIVVIVSITIVFTLFTVRCIVRQYCAPPIGKDQNNYAYDPIAYDGTNEPDQVAIKRNGVDECNLSDSELADETNNP